MIPADAASDDVAAFFLLWHHRDGRLISVYLIDGCCINGRDGSEWPEPTTGGGKWPPQSGCRSRWRPDNAMVNNPAPPFCSRFPSRAALDLLAVAIAAATGIDQSSGTTRRRDNTGPLLRLHPTTLLNGRIIAPPPHLGPATAIPACAHASLWRQVDVVHPPHKEQGNGQVQKSLLVPSRGARWRPDGSS